MTLNSIEQLLNSILSQPQWDKQRRYYQLRKIWYEVVNQKIAQHTSPLYLQEDTLYIATESASWAQDLTLQRRILIIKINRRLETPINDIRFVFGKWYSQYQPPILEADENTLHPCRIKSMESKESASTSPPPQTPQEALEKWLEIVKQRKKENQTCPSCQSFCAEGELKRWGICAYCFREKVSKDKDEQKCDEN